MVLDDIAKALGVSKTTVSRAISGTGRVSQATRERVLAYVQEIGFSPNASASNLASTRTHNIAYSMPLQETAIMSTYFSECLFGVGRVASENGYHVIVVDDRMDELCRVASSKKVDAIVLSLFNHGDDAMKKLLNYHIPIVLTGSTPVPDIIQIEYDARTAYRDLVSYLINAWNMPLGLIVTQKGWPANEARADGFRDAMTVQGIMDPPIVWNAYSKDLMVDGMISLYRRGICGIVCADDSICADLLSALAVFKASDDEKMKRMATNIRLASLHSNRFLRLFHQEIPTVELDPIQMGRLAAQMAIHEIEEGNAPRSTYLTPHLHLGK